MTDRLEDPSKCPICLAFWDFGSTWLGQIVAIHPVTPCVIPPAYRYEVDEEAESEKPRKCEECHMVFRPRLSSPSQTICGADCRRVRQERKRLELQERRGKAWMLLLSERSKLPVRECEECHRRFTITSKWSVKQKLCSQKCRCDRLSRQSKERKSAA